LNNTKFFYIFTIDNDKNMAKVESDIKRVYLDWAASSLYSRSGDSAPFGNPSSHHREGRYAKQALEDARKQCASVLSVSPETLYFTSGGTESNGIALFSNLTRPGKGRVISSLAEHSSIREGMETLNKMGKSTGSITVDSTGRVTAETFTKALDKYGDVRFSAVMSVNNETGAVTDIASLMDVIQKRKESAPIHFHCDLVQVIGKIPVDISNWGIDSASISAHKICGPRGIGLLYLKKPLEAFYTGGGQEKGIRGGTENTQGAIELANCLTRYANTQTVQLEYSRAKSRWKKLMTSLAAMERCTLIPSCRSPEDDRFSPYILQAAFKNIPGEVMARALDDLGFAVSTGSACSSSSPERPVLAAMGIEENLRIEGIRISQGYSTTDEEIELFLEAVAEVLKFL
jgi:cysteine desulfurase